ncbi:MAG: response regulator [Planctomycetota bacterium]|jgi:C4-type Zn-finger protein|nr:response regulator [Planctomycetota bacterium]
MHSPVFFHQGCPVCGRMLRIGVQLLGSRVYCQHCGGGFRASDASLADENAGERPSRTVVDELLERAELVLQRQGAGGEAE